MHEERFRKKKIKIISQVENVMQDAFLRWKDQQILPENGTG